MYTDYVQYSSVIYHTYSVTTRGNEPGSTAQNIIYGSDFANVSVSSPLIQEPGHPLLVSSRGQAPRSTAQLKMYPLRQAMQERVEKKQDKRKLKMPTIESGPSLKYTDNFSFNGMLYMYIYRSTLQNYIL